MHNSLSALKGNLELEGLVLSNMHRHKRMVMHTSLRVHKHTRTHTQPSTRESRSHPGLVFRAQAALLLLLSVSLFTCLSPDSLRDSASSFISICLSTCLGLCMSFVISCCPIFPSPRLFCHLLSSKCTQLWTQKLLSRFVVLTNSSAPEREITLAICWTPDINMTHENAQTNLFMCNEFRAAVWCRMKRGKVQSFKALKA